MGPMAFRGPVGPLGPLGPLGPVGPLGPMGPMGPMGTHEDPWAPWAPWGPRAPRGPWGPWAPPAQGPLGPHGAHGPMGPFGHMGPRLHNGPGINPLQRNKREPPYIYFFVILIPLQIPRMSLLPRQPPVTVLVCRARSGALGTAASPCHLRWRGRSGQIL